MHQVLLQCLHLMLQQMLLQMLWLQHRMLLLLLRLRLQHTRRGGCVIPGHLLPWLPLLRRLLGRLLQRLLLGLIQEIRKR